jgi:hypothetical protein
MIRERLRALPVRQLLMAVLALDAVLLLVLVLVHRESRNAAHRLEQARKECAVETEATAVRARLVERLGEAAARSLPATPRPDTPPNLRPVFDPDLLSEPAYRAVLGAMLADSVVQRYASLFRRLRLSPERMEKLRLLLVRQVRADIDAAESLARSGGPLPADPKALAEAKWVILGSVAKEIRGLLTEDEHDEYLLFHLGRTYALDVQRLGRRLSYTSEPLTEAQRDGLQDVLAQWKMRTRNASPRILSPTQLEELRAFLTPRQIAAFEEYLGQRRVVVP